MLNLEQKPIGILREELAEAYRKLSGHENHRSDCATSVAPAYDPSPCDCDSKPRDLTSAR